jgi:hypothetical protein
MALAVEAGGNWQAASASAASAIRLLIVPPHPKQEDATALRQAQSPKRKEPSM